MVDSRTYYNAYWSHGGFAPLGEPAYPTLASTFDRYVTSGSRCLDVGCGDGSKSGKLLSQCAASYIGVDVSETAVELAQGRGLDARLIADATDLMVADASIDIVVCTEVFEHLFATVETCAEILRVLRPGGVLIVTVPNVAHWRHRVDFALMGRWHPGGDHEAADAPWRDPHIRFFTPRTMARMLARCDFEVVECRGYGDAPIGARLPTTLRRRFGQGDPGLVSRVAYRLAPSVFGTGVLAVARRGMLMEATVQDVAAGSGAADRAVTRIW